MIALLNLLSEGRRDNHSSALIRAQMSLKMSYKFAHHRESLRTTSTLVRLVIFVEAYGMDRSLAAIREDLETEGARIRFLLLMMSNVHLAFVLVPKDLHAVFAP